MAISRNLRALVGGPGEDDLVVIADDATHTGSVVDLLGNNKSVGEAWVYAVISASGTDGQVQFKFNPQRTVGAGYSKREFELAVDPIDGTQKVPLGKRPISRLMNCEVKSDGAGDISVAVLVEVEKLRR